MIEAAIHEAGRQTIRLIIGIAAVAVAVGIAIGYFLTR